MRKEIAEKLALGHRIAMRSALDIRERLDKKLAHNIDEQTLKAREATTKAVEILTAQEEAFRDPKVFRKIRVKDNYTPNGEPSDLLIPQK